MKSYTILSTLITVLASIAETTPVKTTQELAPRAILNKRDHFITRGDLIICDPHGRQTIYGWRDIVAASAAASALMNDERRGYELAAALRDRATFPLRWHLTDVPGVFMYYPLMIKDPGSPGTSFHDFAILNSNYDVVEIKKGDDRTTCGKFDPGNIPHRLDNSESDDDYKLELLMGTEYIPLATSELEAED